MMLHYVCHHTAEWKGPGQPVRPISLEGLPAQAQEGPSELGQPQPWAPRQPGADDDLLTQRL